MRTLYLLKQVLQPSKLVIEWAKVKELLAVLKPVHILTKNLQTEQYVDVDFLADLNRCMVTSYRETAESLAAALKERFKGILGNIQFAAAIYLDPRFVHVEVTDLFEPDHEEEIIVSIYYLTN